MRSNFNRIVTTGFWGAVVMTAVTARAQDSCAPDWLPGQAYPGLDGPAYAMQVWDDGGGPALYVAGDFRIAGATTARSVARWDGTSFSPVGSGLDGIVRALTLHNGELIAAGSFLTAGKTYADSVFRWDGTSWTQLGSSLDAKVVALAAHGGELIVGGAFTGGLARWDGTNWSPLGGGVNGSVHALAVYNAQLIAGGGIHQRGRSARQRHCPVGWRGLVAAGRRYATYASVR